MSGSDETARRTEAAGWLVVAREDIRVARACLLLDPPAHGVAAYHCQQAAEKVAKGLLVAADVEFRKTHDLDELVELVAPSFPECRDPLNAIRPLTVWGIAYRYPAVEEIPEPIPESAELLRIIAIIEQLAGCLNVATTVGNRDETSAQKTNEESGQT